MDSERSDLRLVGSGMFVAEKKRIRRVIGADFRM